MADSASLLTKAQTYLRSASVLLELGDLDSCASRSYFAMFHAAQALLENAKVGTTTRHGIRAAFAEAFVETGRLPARFVEMFDRSAELQELADYSAKLVVSTEQAERALQEAEVFVTTASRVLERAASAD